VITSLSAKRPGLKFFSIEHLDSQAELDEDAFCHDDDFDSGATRIVIFTSGTTGRPKGVRLPYRSYRANRSTFESFLRISEEDNFALLVVNPMHHTNSTAMADWAMRRPGTMLHLIERYSTQYWSLLVDIDGGGHDRVVAPLVSRHFDFLDNLHQTDRLPVGADALKRAMGRMDFLLGSAPVGPTTIKRLKKYTERLPLVRFGSTETCLQVVGTPTEMSDHDRMSAFQKGWSHTWRGDRMSGYYIGRSHPPYTESKIVRSITPGEPDYFVNCREGEPGYLVTRGDNLMAEYVADDEATRKVIHEDGWYTGLGDICFWRTNDSDGQPDHYWMSRDSAMLIRGGANYSYNQIDAELKAFIVDRYALGDDDFDLAVIGLKVESEHEDDCCVTIELKSPSATSRQAEIEATFLTAAGKVVSKGAKPDLLRFAKVPRNFKGAILVPQLKEDYESAICSRT
jgi:acyl-CoA synthetase (AMP-forming)/AMP-acid ligase II